MTEPQIDATVDLAVEVPRGDDGTLRDGITAILDRSDAVSDTEVEAINGISPTTNSLQVDALVHIRVRIDNTVENIRTVVREALADQFGVQSVTTVEINRSPPLRSTTDKIPASQ